MSSAEQSKLPLVSIVMSAYNSERFIGASLDSALAQTHAPIEIIVVNDGSKDGTAAILEVYRQKYGIHVFSQSNGGQCAALNRGLKEARGAYIKFFDSDDILSPNFVETQLRALVGKPRHLAYGTWGRFTHRIEETVFKPHPGWHDSPSGLEWLLETWLNTRPMYQCALFLIPRELLEKSGGWDERLGLINDFEFFSRVVLGSEGIVFTPEARLYYRSNLPGSLSGLKTRKGCESACLSTLLGVRHLLAREDSPRIRRASANMLQANVQSFYPHFPDLLIKQEAEIKRLGGSTLLPRGGRVFAFITRLFGWRLALRLRNLTQR